MVFDGDRMRWVGNEAELDGFDVDSCGSTSEFDCDGDSRACLLVSRSLGCVPSAPSERDRRAAVQIGGFECLAQRGLA
jgi:hypothetical protein